MSQPDVPHVAAWFQGGFHRFLRSFLKRHFHAIAVQRESMAALTFETAEPLLVYANHPSWWDPLIAHFLNLTLFPGRQFYAPIDAKALEQYRVFGKLGFYGVDLESQSGAAAFLKQSNAILNAERATAIWMTPEGQFVDVRDRSVPLMPGLSHFCSKMERGYVIPLALEYVFWDERLPVCISKLGQPIKIADHATIAKDDWSRFLTDELRRVQSELAELSIHRSSGPFENLLRGQRGGGAVYDSFRRLKSLASGRRFRASHGEQFE